MRAVLLPLLVAAAVAALPSCNAALTAGCSDENGCAEGLRCDEGLCVPAASPAPDAGSAADDDGGTGRDDGGTTDGGTDDGGRADAGDTDDAGGVHDDAGGGGTDGGTADGGADDADAGPADAGPADAGPADAGDDDAGPGADAGASSDAGVPCFAGAHAPPATGLALWLSASRSATALSPDTFCVLDASGSGNHACQSSAAARPTVAPFLDRTAFSFDGVDDHLVVPDDGALDPAELTVVVLGTIGDGESWGTVALKASTDAWNDGWGLTRNAGSERLFGFTTRWDRDSIAEDVTYDAPFFASFVATSTALTLTVDDVVNGPSPRDDGAAPTATPLYIGAAPEGSGIGFHHEGAIAELLVYGRALSTSELLAIRAAATACYGID